MNEAGNWYVYSQFEPTDARRAFPCFDEPRFKVPWQLRLNVPAGEMALSNTPVASEATFLDGRKSVEFAVTKPLPSYLVAFAVGPFEAVDARTMGSVRLRVITPRGRAREAQYAAAIIPKILKRLEDYFGTPYPYDKLDSVAMPVSNFAMENAGLITYAQKDLLVDSEHDSILRQRECASTVTHEMAHQWLGDLVTAEWWDDIWLNEAFATWMQRKIVSEWKSDWAIDADAASTRLDVMDLDSLLSARRVREPIESADDIANAFDGITYQKGAAVIQMFESWIGVEKFRAGVRLYLKEHAWGTATTSNFLSALNTVTGRDVRRAFNTFVDQPGVPIVSVSLDCSGRTPQVQLEQRRFLQVSARRPDQELWDIPVCVRYGAMGTRGKALRNAVEPPVADASFRRLSRLGNDRRRRGGLLSSLVRRHLLQQLLADKGAKLTIPERVNVLGGLRALVDTGGVFPSVALSAARDFADDPDRNVVAQSIKITQILRKSAVTNELWPEGVRFVHKIYGPRARNLGWTEKDSESEDRRLLRRILVPFEASMGDDETLFGQARQLARQWLDRRVGITPELVEDVLETAAEFGDRVYFDRLHSEALHEKDPRKEKAILDAMGSFRDPAIAKLAMSLLLTREFDSREAFRPLLFRPLYYPATRNLPFLFVRENLNPLLANLSSEIGSNLAAELPVVGRAFCDADSRAQVETFFKHRVNNFTGGPRNLAQTLETIDICADSRARLNAGISEFLKDY